jgi:hypothetical protein
MKAIFAFILIASFGAVRSFAGTDWWLVPTTDFLHLEEMNSYNMYTLGLRSDASATYQIKNTSGVNPCTCSQLNLTPPVGKENRWLGILMTAITTSQPLVVYGNCANGILDIDAKQSTGRLTMGN